MSDNPSTDTIMEALKIVGDNLMSTDESSARVCRQAAHRLNKHKGQIQALWNDLKRTETRAEWLQAALSEAEHSLEQIDNMECE